MDTETCQLLRRAVRRFVDERLIPAEDQVEQGKFLAIRCDGNPAMVADVQF